LKSLEPIRLGKEYVRVSKNQDRKMAGSNGMFRTADDYYNHEYSQVQDFSLQTVLSTQATEGGLETEANEIVSRMYG
jgi:hypothetical protein